MVCAPLQKVSERITNAKAKEHLWGRCLQGSHRMSAAFPPPSLSKPWLGPRTSQKCEMPVQIESRKSGIRNTLKTPEGPTIKKIWYRSKFSISIEICDLARNFQSRHRDFPTKKRAAVGGLLEIFILDRNFQSRSKSRIFLICGPFGTVTSLNKEARLLKFHVS